MIASAGRDAFHELLVTFKAEIRLLTSSLTFVLPLIFVLGPVLA